jgi:hypothetical protein
MKKKPTGYQILKDKLKSTETELANVKNVKNAKPQKKQLVSTTIPFVTTLYRVQSDLTTFNNALIYAMNIMNPNRTELFRLFNDIMLDGHLSSVIQTRKASVLGAEFMFTQNGKENPTMSDMFKTKWFYDFVNLSLDSAYLGFSLIEFGDLIDDEFQSITEVPRQYVKPEFSVVSPTTGGITGASYLEPPYSDWAMFIGEKNNLGLLVKCAPYVLWKRNAMMAYAEFCEMNQAIRILKTDAYDEETRQAGENFMRTMGNSAYAILGKEDVVEFAESRNAAGAESLYNGLVDKCNEEISKLILGGTGMTDAKSFVGSAEIHQETFLLLCTQDKIFIQNVLNHQLIPFLILHGFPLEGWKIEVKPEEELSLVERFKVDAKLLDYFDFKPEYFRETYGADVYPKGSLYPEVKETEIKPEDPITNE